MVKRTIENFSMAQICDSGECVRMTPIDENTYSVIASGRYLEFYRELGGKGEAANGK